MRTRTDLSRDAFKINGVFLEDVIDGYTTLKATGRETMEKVWVDYQATKTDGQIKNYLRYPRREIKITYCLAATKTSDLTAQYNKLNAYLDIVDATIIFNDESDKYLIGTLTGEKQTKKKYGTVAEGTLTIRCDDPFKYSTSETEVTAIEVYPVEGLDEYDSTVEYVVGDMVKHNNRGYTCIEDTTGEFDEDAWGMNTGHAFITNNDANYTTYPRFEIQFATDEDAEGKIDTRADDGYIQFAKDENVLQFGNPYEEAHTPEPLWNYAFNKTTVRGDYEWAPINTVIPTTTYVNKADISMTTTGLKPNYGKLSNEWHGSYIVAPVTAQGNFYYEWTQTFALNSTTSTAKAQKGVMMAMVLDENDNVIAGIKLLKDATKTTNGIVSYFNQEGEITNKPKSFAFTGDFGYVKAKQPRLQPNSITREGNKIIFNLAGDTQSFTAYGCSTEPAAKVAFFMGQYSTTAACTANLINSAKFINGDTGNTFTSSDLLIVDATNGNVTLNGKNAQSIGDIGNNWTNFVLTSGNNLIYVFWSDWMEPDYLPTCKMYFRKRWI